jgi:2',3'-cyclic-nucleotide 2'-phosphodiesterase (5'-nucleotidase family)
VRALAATVKDRTGKDLLEKVGETQGVLEGVEPAVRGRETALGDFLTDVMRDRMKTDLALLNGGAIRINDNIPPGPVTRYDLEGIFYFSERLVTFELTGAELLDVLRHGVAKVHAGAGQFLQVSSIRFRYHPGGTADAPTYRIDAADVSVRPRGAPAFVPLDVARRYSVATVGYERESLCAKGIVPSCKGQTLPAGTLDRRQATEEAIAALPGRRITAAVEGRIARAESP